MQDLIKSIQEQAKAFDSILTALEALEAEPKYTEKQFVNSTMRWKRGGRKISALEEKHMSDLDTLLEDLIQRRLRVIEEKLISAATPIREQVRAMDDALATLEVNLKEIAKTVQCLSDAIKTLRV